MVVREFEAVAPGAHRYVAIRGFAKEGSSQSDPRVWLSLQDFRSELRKGDYQAVVVHCLDTTSFFQDIPDDKVVAWLGWGIDYYTRLLERAYPKGLLLPRTRALCRRSIPYLWKQSKARVRRLLGRSFKFDPRLVKRVDYFTPVLNTEYDLVKKHNPSLRAEYIEWNYGTVEDDWASEGHYLNPSPGQDVLLGNSATPENNHADVLQLLANTFDIGDRTIVCPLSYGEKWYADSVARLGTKLFGNRFVALTDFVPEARYREILDKCGYVFMNHLRQQALGNLCISMLQGATVYLQQANPLFAWFSQRGVTVRPIPNNDQALAEHSTQRFVLEPLSESECETNALVLTSHWQRASARKRTGELINALLTPRRS
jgi:dTDP-N-acetylfucosamine:lipid II N-acetylfucosaminyltransferase